MKVPKFTERLLHTTVVSDHISLFIFAWGFSAHTLLLEMPPLGKPHSNSHRGHLGIACKGGGTVGQDVVELICQSERKMRQNATFYL